MRNAEAYLEPVKYLRWSFLRNSYWLKALLCEICANKEFFLVHIFPLFGLNTGKYGPEKTPYLDIFHVALRCQTWF